LWYSLFKPRQQFFSYVAAVTITSDRAANVDLCLALKALIIVVSAKGHGHKFTGISLFFTIHNLCISDHRTKYPNHITS
jgi:hypothetical protein